MTRFKRFKTFVRKKLGLIGVAEFVDNPVDANSKDSWNNLFVNKKFLSEYTRPDRIKSYQEIVTFLNSRGVFDNIGTIVDMGCGTGHLLQEIKKIHPSIHLSGSDFSEESVEVSKRILPEADFFVADLYSIEASLYGRFDLVFCNEVLEHLLHPEIALTNLFRLLTQHGSIIIGVPNGRIDTYQGHIHFWSPESWKVFIDNNVDHEKYRTEFLLLNNQRNNLAIISSK